MTPTRAFEMLDEAMVAPLRMKTPAEHLAISNGMWRSARRMIETILRQEHPNWSAARNGTEDVSWNRGTWSCSMKLIT